MFESVGIDFKRGSSEFLRYPLATFPFLLREKWNILGYLLQQPSVYFRNLATLGIPFATSCLHLNSSGTFFAALLGIPWTHSPAERDTRRRRADLFAAQRSSGPPGGDFPVRLRPCASVRALQNGPCMTPFMEIFGGALFRGPLIISLYVLI